MKKCILFLLLLTLVFPLSSCTKEIDDYNWTKVDNLLESIGNEEHILDYYGNDCLDGTSLNIYNKNDENVKVVYKLYKLNDNEEIYYSLFFDIHYINLVENKIISTCLNLNFYTSDEYKYISNTISIDYFDGLTESIENYQVYRYFSFENIAFFDDQFVSAQYNELSIIGIDDSNRPILNLPEEDEYYMNYLLKNGFEKTIAYFNLNDLEQIYPYLVANE